VPIDTVIDAIIGYAQRRIDQLVGEGVSETTAAQAKERLPLWAARFVERRGDSRSRWTRNASLQ